MSCVLAYTGKCKGFSLTCPRCKKMYCCSPEHDHLDLEPSVKNDCYYYSCTYSGCKRYATRKGRCDDHEYRGIIWDIRGRAIYDGR